MMKSETNHLGTRLWKLRGVAWGNLVEIGQRCRSGYTDCIRPATDEDDADIHLKASPWPRRIARGCGVGVALLGVVVLLGWVLDIDLIKSMLPGLVEMKANTALCFLLSGVVLWATVSAGCKSRRWIRSVGTFLVIAIGLATVFEYLSGANLGIDELLIRDPPDTDAAYWILPPGRMALASAVAFVMAGCSLLLLRGRATVVAQLLACTTALIALFSLATYLWRDLGTTGIGPYTSLALDTTVGFTVLAVGLLAAAPPRGPVAILMSATRSGALVRLLLPLVIGVTLVLGVLEAVGQRAGWYGEAHGRALFVLIEATVLVGSILYVAHRAFLSEVTARESEKQVRRLNEMLEQRVVERTQALADSNEQVTTLLDSTAEGIYGLDLEGEGTFFNAAALRMLGYDRAEDLLGKDLHQVLHHSYADGTPILVEACQIRRVFRDDSAAHVADEVLWRRDGTSIPVEYWSHPVRKNGQITGCVVSFLDITQRKKAQEELDRFFNLMPSLMVVAGFDGYVKRVNPAALSIGGWSSIDDLKAEPFLNYFHPDDRGLIASRFQLLLAGGSTQTFEARSRYHVDSYRWFSWSAAAFSDWQVIFATAQDISELKRTEEELAERARLAALTADVGLALTREATMAGMLRKCAEALVLHVEAAFARVWTLNVAEQVLELQASAGLYTHIDGNHARIPMGQFKIGEIARTRQPHLTNGVIGDPRVHDQEWARREGMVAFAGYPLVVEDQLVGVVALFSRQPLTETMLTALASVADGIALGTQRRQAEDSLRLNLAAMEAAANGIVITDVNGTLEWVNPAFTKMTGYSAAEAIGQSLSVLKPGTQTPEFYQQLWKTIRAGNVWRGDVVNKRKDGILFNEEMTITPVRDTAGQITHLVAIKQDITERKRIEQRLATNEQLLRTILDVLPQRVFWKDRAGRYLGCNRVFLQDAGMPSVVGLTDFDMPWKPEEARHYRECDERVTARNRSELDITETQKNAAGENTWLLTNKMPLSDANGVVVGVIGTFQDITHLKRIEVELVQARDAADAANRAKSEFLANMSHEIRTPMNGIIGLTGLVLDTALDDEQRQYLEGVMLSAESLLKLINSILDFSKIEAGKLELEQTDFELRETLGVAIKTLALRAHEKQVELLFEVLPNVPDTLIGDSSRLANVVINLIGNALKFTKHGEVSVLIELVELDEELNDGPKFVADAASVRVETGEISRNAPASGSQSDGMSEPGARSVSTYREGEAPAEPSAGKDSMFPATQQELRPPKTELTGTPDNSVCLRFTVSDTGIGIPADKQTQLFQPFTQVDASTTRKYGGTGLGLVISQKFVEIMGGRIWFESEEGHGSQFHFTARFGVRTTPVDKPAKLLPSELQGLRVLVVDDNPTNRRILTVLLTGWRMNPIAVDSGAAALETLMIAVKAQEPFSLILLDVMMPGMDGFAVLEHIRRLPEIDRPTILMLSSADQRGDIAQARALGAAGYLLKPLKPNELLNTIVTVLGQSQQAELPAANAPRKPVESHERPLRILLAEDNALNQLLAKRTLEKAGHSVVVANNGEEALATLGRENFDLILMDIQMPVMDGFQATARIREQEQTTSQHQPIVAMTAHALKGDRERCLEAGMDGYVSKPIRNSELFAAIAAVVKDTHTPLASRAASAPELDDVPRSHGRQTVGF